MRIDLHCDGVETAPGLRDYIRPKREDAVC